MHIQQRYRLNSQPQQTTTFLFSFCCRYPPTEVCIEVLSCVQDLPWSLTCRSHKSTSGSSIERFLLTQETALWYCCAWSCSSYPRPGSNLAETLNCTFTLLHDQLCKFSHIDGVDGDWDFGVVWTGTTWANYGGTCQMSFGEPLRLRKLLCLRISIYKIDPLAGSMSDFSFSLPKPGQKLKFEAVANLLLFGNYTMTEPCWKFVSSG